MAKYYFEVLSLVFLFKDRFSKCEYLLITYSGSTFMRLSFLS